MSEEAPPAELGHSKMKVMHIISGDLWGGAEAQMLFQLEALNKENINVEVLLFNQSDTLARYQKAGLKCTVINESNGFVFLCQKAKRHAVAIKADLIVSHGYKEAMVAFYVSKSTSKPHVVTFHGSLEVYPGLQKSKFKLYSNTHKFIAKFFGNRIVTVSKALAKELGFEASDKLRVLHNVVDLDASTPTTKASLPEKPAIVIVGRLAKVKRVDLAIEALQHLLEHSNFAHLYIVGSGGEQESLVRQVADSNLNKHVTFLGFREDARALIARADLVLLTSDSEGIPTVILESIAESKPIVSSNLPGVKEVFEFFPGYPVKFFDPGDGSGCAQMLADALIGIENAFDKSASHLENLFQNFSPHAAVIKHQKIYRELLEET